MQILLACAKNMTTRPELSPSILTKPKFLEEAERHALQLAAHGSGIGESPEM